jgi:hypothetical protein
VGVDELEAYEQRVHRAGLPLLIEGWSAREDALPRAFPLLAIVFGGELLGALNLTWSPLANVGALAAGLALLLGGIALANKMRGRPATALPRDLGPLELALFVVLPALLPLLFGGQVTSALVTAGANVVLVALAAFGFGFGLLAIVTWALRRVAGQLATSLLLLARAVPLLMLFAFVLFLTTEMWQVFAEIGTGSLIGVGALLIGVGTLFLVVRLPREVSKLEEEAGAGPPLSRPQRLNVGLVMLVSQGLQVLVVSVAIGLFFVAFGLLAVSADVREAWIQTAGHHIGPRGLGLTVELVRVSAVIAALSGLYTRSRCSPTPRIARSSSRRSPTRCARRSPRASSTWRVGIRCAHDPSCTGPRGPPRSRARRAGGRGRRHRRAWARRARGRLQRLERVVELRHDDRALRADRARPGGRRQGGLDRDREPPVRRRPRARREQQGRGDLPALRVQGLRSAALRRRERPRRQARRGLVAVIQRGDPGHLALDGRLHAADQGLRRALRQEPRLVGGQPAAAEEQVRADAGRPGLDPREPHRHQRGRHQRR